MVDWKPISELFDFEKGTLQSSKCRAGAFTFVTAAEEWKTHESFTHDCEALIFAMAASGSLGRTHYVNGKFIASDLCFILTPRRGIKLDLMFYFRLFNFLRSNIVKTTSTGTSKLAINQTNFGAYRIPYFDFEHQLLFRDKIERINEISQNFDGGLNDQLALLKQLRQAILHEAIEGKLTADWRKEHPELICGENHASKLLEKIWTENEKLVRDGKIKGRNYLPMISNDKKPFVLPNDWIWARLGDISQIFAGCSFESHAFNKNNGVKCVKITNAGVRELIETNDFLPLSYQGKYKDYIVKENDLIIALTRPYISSGLKISKCPKSYENALLNQRVAAIRNIYGINFDYVYSFMVSDYVLNGYKEKFDKVNQQPNLRMSDLTDLIVPFPAAAEQQAIVERIDKLMIMIDELENQVIERKDQSEMLMQSVLREAFSC